MKIVEKSKFLSVDYGTHFNALALNLSFGFVGNPADSDDVSSLLWKKNLICNINSRVIEFLRNFEFRNWHAMRGGLMLPDSISEEKLKIG